jgi:hypothetical protein
VAPRAHPHRILPTKDLNMILPIALVERWPGEEYRLQHSTIESALKHNVSDTLKLINDVKILREIEATWENVEPLTKQARFDLKRSTDVTLCQRVRDYIIEKDNKLERCIKNSDYPAMVMATFKDSKFIDKDQFKENMDAICQSPVLLRGISSGKIAKAVRKRKQDFYFIETGYLGNYPCDNNRTGRKIYHRIVKNDMQHCDRIMDVPDDRYQELVAFNPAMEYKGWKKTGSKILVVLPTEKPFQYYNEDRDLWVATVEKTIREYSDREIVWREKASRGERTNNTIYEALDDDIYCLVTYNSIAAVEAIQHGIPAFALAPTAAAPVCSADLTQIENPVMLSEDVIYKWLCSVAYGQFNLTEILTGRAWEMVLENDTRPTFSY